MNVTLHHIEDRQAWNRALKTRRLSDPGVCPSEYWTKLFIVFIAFCVLLTVIYILLRSLELKLFEALEIKFA